MSDCNKCIWSRRDGGCNSWDCSFIDQTEAANAMTSAQPETHEERTETRARDLISRQAAIDALTNEWDGMVTSVFDAIKELPSAQPKWIPVTERLPEYGTEVVTINKDDEYEINHVIDEEDGEWFFDGAVAWMPLPEPYAERRQNGQ